MQSWHKIRAAYLQRRMMDTLKRELGTTPVNPKVLAKPKINFKTSLTKGFLEVGSLAVDPVGASANIAMSAALRNSETLNKILSQRGLTLTQVITADKMTTGFIKAGSAATNVVLDHMLTSPHLPTSTVATFLDTAIKDFNKVYDEKLSLILSEEFDLNSLNEMPKTKELVGKILAQKRDGKSNCEFLKKMFSLKNDNLHNFMNLTVATSMYGQALLGSSELSTSIGDTYSDHLPFDLQLRLALIKDTKITVNRSMPDEDVPHVGDKVLNTCEAGVKKVQESDVPETVESYLKEAQILSEEMKSSMLDVLRSIVNQMSKKPTVSPYIE